MTANTNEIDAFSLWMVKLSIGSAVSAFVGLHWTLQLLIILIAFDIATGIIRSAQIGAISSEISRKGITNKALILLFVAMSEIVGRYLGFEFDTPFADGVWGLGSVVAGFYVVNELVSITENLAASGVPIPKVIVSMLEKMREIQGLESKR